MNSGRKKHLDWVGVIGPTNGRWGFIVTGYDGDVDIDSVMFYSRQIVKGINGGKHLGMGRVIRSNKR